MARRNDFVVIVGCGRLGAHLANSLSHAKKAVVVIDRRAEAFTQLSTEFSGFTIEGDATELEVLKRAKTAKAELFIAVSQSDNINLMTAQIAQKHFGVERVIARVCEPSLEEFYRMVGVEIVSPTTVTAKIILGQ